MFGIVDNHLNSMTDILREYCTQYLFALKIKSWLIIFESICKTVNLCFNYPPIIIVEAQAGDEKNVVEVLIKYLDG